MGRKDDRINELENEVQFLEDRIEILKNAPTPTITKPKKKNRYAGSLSFDFWPPSDWARFGVTNWNPGKYFQLYIGPIRLDIYAD